MERIIVDTGPLVAYLDRSDSYHGWARDRMSELSDPLLTCESVLAEASFLLRRGGINPSILVELVARGILEMPIDFQRESSGIARFMQRYDSVPMSLADACLVRLSELHERSRVFTLDSDFRIYRRSGRKVIPLLAPWS